MAENTNDLVVRMVPKWKAKVGPKEALRRLVIAGVPPVTADKIVSGRYRSTPRDLLARAILREMEKDGLTLSKGRAS